MAEASSFHDSVVDAEVIDSSVIDEGNLRRLLRKAGRGVARPTLEVLELLMDPATPPKARLTLLAALTYLVMPADLVPDFLPIAGFSDDLVGLTAVIGLWRHHLTDDIRLRAKRKLDRWFPPGQS